MPNPAAPEPSIANSGYSATLIIPYPTSAATLAATTSRSAGVLTIRRTPAQTPSWAASLLADTRKVPRIESTSVAERTNEAALNRNVAGPPNTATTTPPTRPPRTTPAAAPENRAAVARARSDSGTSITRNADEAGWNGAPASAPTPARTTRISGECSNANATKTAADERSDAIITTRRSKRSPSTPAHGAVIA